MLGTQLCCLGRRRTEFGRQDLMQFSRQGILLDIEGTTSSISFVYDVMFPFVREHLAAFLDQHWQAQDVQNACAAMAQDEGFDSAEKWFGANDGRDLVQATVIRLMDDDVKATGLKKLQGLIWRQGFESGQLQAHLYDEVAENIQRWVDAGMDVRIYSSGSVQAQQLFFGHTVVGDLSPLFRGHYDTTTGSKRESDSYTAIGQDFDCEIGDVLFVSDVVAELDAARQAGMQTVLSVRPGNPDQPAHDHPAIRDFAEIVVHSKGSAVS